MKTEFKNEKTIGHVQAFMELYAKNALPFTTLDHLWYGNGKIGRNYPERTVASFVWEKDTHDQYIPVFNFFGFEPKQNYELTKRQFFFRPYFGDYEHKNWNYRKFQCNWSYVIQELRKKLSFEEVDYIIWIRDEHNGDFSLARDYLEAAKDKADLLVGEYCWVSLPEYTPEHALLCAVYDYQRKDKDV